MSKMAFLVGCVCLAAAVGCSGTAETDVAYTPLSANPGGPELPLCRWIASNLTGHTASIYPVKDDPDLVAVDVNNEIVCVEGSEAILRVGIIAVPPIVRPACSICDGTPLPADVFNDRVRHLHLAENAL